MNRGSETVIHFNIRTANESGRVVVFKMLELYQHDLSDIWDQDLDAHWLIWRWCFLRMSGGCHSSLS